MLTCFLVQLTGTISPRIGQLSNMYRLYMSNCQGLSGTIPSEIGLLTSLKELDLRSTGVAGPIPEELFSLTKLEALYLGNTRLSGTISSKIGQLSSLSWLDLAETQISGTLPDEMFSLPRVSLLQLNGNRNLTGSIPEAYCSKQYRERLELIVDCAPSLSTGVPSVTCPEGCCTSCCNAETKICQDP